jgi:hypothetical protein
MIAPCETAVRTERTDCKGGLAERGEGRGWTKLTHPPLPRDFRIDCASISVRKGAWDFPSHTITPFIRDTDRQTLFE